MFNLMTLVYSMLCFFVEPGIIPRNLDSNLLNEKFQEENYAIDFDSLSKLVYISLIIFNFFR